MRRLHEIYAFTTIKPLLELTCLQRVERLRNFSSRELLDGDLGKLLLYIIFYISLYIILYILLWLITPSDWLQKFRVSFHLSNFLFVLSFLCRFCHQQQLLSEATNDQNIRQCNSYLSKASTEPRKKKEIETIQHSIINSSSGFWQLWYPNRDVLSNLSSFLFRGALAIGESTDRWRSRVIDEETVPREC